MIINGNEIILTSTGPKIGIRATIPRISANNCVINPMIITEKAITLLSI